MKLFCVKHNRKEPDESFCCPECEAEALAEIEAEEAECCEACYYGPVGQSHTKVHGVGDR